MTVFLRLSSNVGVDLRHMDTGYPRLTGSTDGPVEPAPPPLRESPGSVLGRDGEVASHVAVAADALLGHGHCPIALPLVTGERAVPAVRAGLLRREAEEGLAGDPLLLVLGAGDLDVHTECRGDRCAQEHWEDRQLLHRATPSDSSLFG